MPHHPLSVAVVNGMAQMDFDHAGDSFCIKTGGDGDNGETMMFLIDEYLSKLAPAELKRLAASLVGK